MEERLQKILSRHGVASRRKAEELIAARRVRVNGNTAQLGDTADEQTDVIEVDGVRLKRAAPEHLYMMLNKPRGYVTTLSDEKGRRTVADLVADLPERVYPVGRLDLNSEGLLLLTNDGELANRLMHPKQEIRKGLSALGQPLCARRGAVARRTARDRWPEDQPRPRRAAAAGGRDGAASRDDPRGPQPADPPPGRARGADRHAPQAHRRRPAPARRSRPRPVSSADGRGAGNASKSCMIFPNHACNFQGFPVK